MTNAFSSAGNVRSGHSPWRWLAMSGEALRARCARSGHSPWRWLAMSETSACVTQAEGESNGTPSMIGQHRTRWCSNHLRNYSFLSAALSPAINASFFARDHRLSCRSRCRQSARSACCSDMTAAPDDASPYVPTRDHGYDRQLAGRRHLSRPRRANRWSSAACRQTTCGRRCHRPLRNGSGWKKVRPFDSLRSLRAFSLEMACHER